MMNPLSRAINHITETAKIPSFSSYEERLHPYVHEVFDGIADTEQIESPGNNLIFRVGGKRNQPAIALTAHLDKINHYGMDYPDPLPVQKDSTHVEGAMDNCAGLGIILTLAELLEQLRFPDLLFFFSEMEESKGLKEHPERIKNNGEGYEPGMGARQIAQTCLQRGLIPSEVITIDTTPLFKGEPGVALYSKHWELNELNPSKELVNQTEEIEQKFLSIDSKIKLENNTNDYLHYGQVFNQSGEHVVPSVALEPSIYPYHQQGERVFIDDIKRVLDILITFLSVS